MKRACGNGNIANVGCSLYIVIIGCRVHIGQNQGIIVSLLFGLPPFIKAFLAAYRKKAKVRRHIASLNSRACPPALHPIGPNDKNLPKIRFQKKNREIQAIILMHATV